MLTWWLNWDSASSDKSIRVWDTSVFECVSVLEVIGYIAAVVFEIYSLLVVQCVGSTLYYFLFINQLYCMPWQGHEDSVLHVRADEKRILR